MILAKNSGDIEKSVKELVYNRISIGTAYDKPTLKKKLQDIYKEVYARLGVNEVPNIDAVAINKWFETRPYEHNTKILIQLRKH